MFTRAGGRVQNVAAPEQSKRAQALSDATKTSDDENTARKHATNPKHALMTVYGRDSDINCDGHNSCIPWTRMVCAMQPLVDQLTHRWRRLHVIQNVAAPEQSTRAQALSDATKTSDDENTARKHATNPKHALMTVYGRDVPRASR